ncbi:ZC3H11 [Lepeophtheirus salmonis]|uniref:ZC3H11 n=1 Tax=Lepeophtheirus salmonis TaxID=72036 RepID=A0A7R8CJ85_LEPSM|nr:ZC3H11 [Lepeophtheirus salmonis]CAF2839955.1 ZC3H11 [Lepeophtheirus salmonis]
MEDCYFFYNSDCTKGSTCQFRHEPTALNSDVVCAFWLKGHCSRVPCPYRHAELGEKTHSSTPQSTPCFWESRPGGLAIAEPPPIIIPPVPQSSKIIVNKNKLNELGSILAQQRESSERIVLPATSKLPVKHRLGSKKSCVKDRLGVRKEDHLVGSDEQVLREKAIQSLDLRKRIGKSPETEEEEHQDVFSENESSNFIVKSLVQKRRRSSSESDDNYHSECAKEVSETPSEGEKSDGGCDRPSPRETGFCLAARALRDLKTAPRRKRKGSSMDETKESPKKRDRKKIFENVAKEMETINEAISESSDVLRQLEDLINN